MASIYKTASGWRAQVRLKDKPTASKLFASKREATVWAREEEERLHKSSSVNPLATYAIIHEEYTRAARAGGTTKQAILKYLLDYWGDWRMVEITTKAVSDYAARRKRDGLGPASILQELTYMGVVLEHGGTLAGNEEAIRARAALRGALKTLRAVGMVGDPNERARRPTEAELALIEDWCDLRPRSSLPLFDIVLFAIATCMRLGEIVGAKGFTYADLDLDNRLVTIRDRKNGPMGKRSDIVPLLVGPFTYKGVTIDPLYIVGRQRRSRLRAERVFPFSKSAVTAAFISAVKECQIDDLHFHDLRHDGISRLFEHGYQIPEVAVVSGHKSWRHLQRYTHIKPALLHDSK